LEKKKEKNKKLKTKVISIGVFLVWWSRYLVGVITWWIDSRTIKRGETRREMQLSKVPLDVLTHCICIQILVSANTLENICENMLTHVHKVKHLVVSIFDQGWRSWRRGGVVFTDRTQVPKWLNLVFERPVNFSEDGALGLCLDLDLTLHSICDRTQALRVRSGVTYADVCFVAEPERTWRRATGTSLDVFDAEGHREQCVRSKRGLGVRDHDLTRSARPVFGTACLVVT
jgi:hypothetical protein